MNVLLFCLALSGCGVQGEPVPPLLDLPERAEVRAVQRGSRAMVGWAAPARTTEGQAVRPEKLGPVEVYRAVLPGLRAEVSRQEFEASAQRVATLTAGRVEYSEELPGGRAGSTIAYAVRLLNRRGDSAGFSNIAAVAALAAPPPPAALHLQPTEGAILIDWPAVDGAAAYHLYKGEDQGPMELLARTAEPRYADGNFQFGRSYRYLVRALSEQGAFHAESADSAVAFIRPEDRFPPAVPAHLAAVPGGSPLVVELSWDPNAEADLAGYNLYRSEDGGAARRLNKELLVSPAFRDEAVKMGTSYSYLVTAVDQKGNESARSEALRVKTEKP